MKTLIQMGFASLAKMGLQALRSLWLSIEDIVIEIDDRKDMTGPQKLSYVIDRVMYLVPSDRRGVARQIITAIVEMVLVFIRIRKQA